MVIKRYNSKPSALVKISLNNYLINCSTPDVIGLLLMAEISTENKQICKQVNKI